VSLRSPHACSLESEGRGGNKRKRTRHQHFWRNTDKLDSAERVYIPTSSIKPALHRNQPVVPKSEISPEERTNAWTVCLTTRGVVSYLNKRISPLGNALLSPPPPLPALYAHVPRRGIGGRGGVSWIVSSTAHRVVSHFNKFISPLAPWVCPFATSNPVWSDIG